MSYFRSVVNIYDDRVNEDVKHVKLSIGHYSRSMAVMTGEPFGGPLHNANDVLNLIIDEMFKDLRSKIISEIDAGRPDKLLDAVS